MRKLDDASKRKKFPLWLSQGERLLLEAKAEEYGYIHLSDYIRDAAIYESLIKVIPHGIPELITAFQEYNTEVKKYTKEVRRILRNIPTSEGDEIPTITETEKKTLQNTLYAVYNGIKALRKETAEKVDYEVIEKYAKEKIDDERYKIED